MLQYTQLFISSQRIGCSVPYTIRKIHHDLSGVSGKITSKVLWKMTMNFVLGGFILHFSNFLPKQNTVGSFVYQHFCFIDGTFVFIICKKREQVNWVTQHLLISGLLCS